MKTIIEQIEAFSFEVMGENVVSLSQVVNFLQSKTTIQLRLETDYIGKNEEWFAGETKWFNIKEMRE
jgi:hypothetical protein